jgi:hypothetical protein
VAEVFSHSLRETLLASSSKHAVVGLLALGVISGALPSGNHTNCVDTYKSYLEQLKRREMSPERRAALHRWAQRAFDACQTGDLEDPKGLFERLDRENY